MYLPAFPAIAADLHTGIARVGYSLASYFIRISFGQLLYGPPLDRFGRRRPLLALYAVDHAGDGRRAGHRLERRRLRRHPYISGSSFVFMKLFGLSAGQFGGSSA